MELVTLLIGHKEAFNLSEESLVPQGKVYFARSTMCGMDDPYVVDRSLKSAAPRGIRKLFLGFVPVTWMGQQMWLILSDSPD